MKFTKLLVCIVALLFAVTAVGCSAQSTEPPASVAPSSSAASPVEQASCSGVHMPTDGAHPRPEVWTAFDDEATLQAVAESVGAKKVLNAFSDPTYMVSSINDVESYWSATDRSEILAQISDEDQADYFIVLDYFKLCGTAT